MTTTSLAHILTSVQFTAAPDGRRLAVLEADDWQGLLEWLEDVEDQRVVQAALDRLRIGPEAAGAISLERALSTFTEIEGSSLGELVGGNP